MPKYLLRVIPLVLVLFLCAVVFAPTARADEWNKKTVVTFSSPVEIPTGKVLPAGTYVMKLLDSPSNRHIVQIFDQDEKHIEATILAIPNYRMEPTGKTVVTFYELPAGQNTALRAWFYPGDNFGQEFAYPKNRGTEIASVTHTQVPELTSEDQANLEKRPSSEQQPPEQVAQEPPPANTPPPPQEQAAPASPPPAPEQAPAATETMPQTASYLPLSGLLGLLSLGLGAGIRRILQR